ncbi:unnamed protein product [Effrenium voratum]|uniref:Uncharacterized protein n=1 Tax=Effrenium voratum TaxID=2562239 RepID=A0AA36IAD1_9DINO|nr:unnamed protein product [Effrenium voratum]CAJ1383065.1 unnamed protein product [Effrenium voratum]|mmetsp:Transcript_112910/g.269020  ORF Transcript_112910/g.269020 Transcript_112910/m.269020 type:complete len:554 (-) Transcript_112910:39-1700(-)
MARKEVAMEGKIWPPVWVYGINDHLDIPSELPPGFEPSGLLCADFRKLCATVNAATHPAFRAKLARRVKEPSKSLPSPHEARRRPSLLGKNAHDISLSLSEEKPPKEGPNLAVKSFLFDRATMSLLSLLLPSVQNVKVLCFSDCNLDCEMLRLLSSGLVSHCSVESLQIEWNSLDLPLPTLEEEDQQEEEENEVPAFDKASSLLEARERKRYTMQSDRLLLNFREWLESRFQGLEAAWRVLDLAGVDWDAKLQAPDFHVLLYEKLGVSGQQVLEVFEVLDGPDYGADGGVTMEVMREALQGLPEIGEDDPLGLSLAGFLEPSSVLECVSFRACAISRFELGPMSTALAKCPWQLRALNLWDNRICDKGAELLAFALDAYRGLEYLGLGRNRITEQGLRALCQPFQPCPLALEEVPAAKERISKQQAAAKAVAEAKEKAQAQGTEFSGRQRRASVPLVDELEEREEGAVLRKLSELRCLVLSENPIKSADVLEACQSLGPRGADLVLRGTAAAAELGARRPELLREKERKPLLNLGHAKDSGPAEGWVLRLNPY